MIDRNISVGLEGALFSEVKAALYGESDAKVYGFIAGLGGKDVTYKDIETMCTKAMKGKAKEQEWYGYGGNRNMALKDLPVDECLLAGKCFMSRMSCNHGVTFGVKSTWEKDDHGCSCMLYRSH